MKMYKRIFGVLLCLCMLLGAVSLASAEGEGTGGHSHKLCEGTVCTNPEHIKDNNHAIVTFEKALTMNDDGVLCIGGTEAQKHNGENYDYILPEGTYYLDGDLTLHGGIQVSGSVTLCLNGHAISNDYSHVIQTPWGGDATFTLCDCKGGGKIAHVENSSSTGTGVNLNNTGGKQQAFIMYNGCITQNKGSGVYLYQNTSFTMYGGSITGNTLTDTPTFGGGVYVSSEATFAMYGGEITKNQADYGGGVYVASEASFTMSGGSITKNHAGKIGGGIYSTSDNISIYGGSVTDNSVTKTGKAGGIYVPDSGTLTVGGNVNISGNWQGDRKESGNNSNVYLDDSATIAIETSLTGAPIGVTTATSVATNDTSIKIAAGKGTHAITDADKGHFTPDTGYCKVEKKDDGIYLTHVHSGGTATCTAKAKCGGCNAPYGDALGHDFENSTIYRYNGTQHWKKCSRCDVEDTANKKEHTGGTATCTEKAICTTCGQPYGDLDTTNHDFEHGTYLYDNTQHWKKCSRCDVTDTKSAHTGGTATCTEAKTCTVCNQQYGNSLGHEYTVLQKDETYHWHECSRCNVKDAEISHTYNQEVVASGYLKNEATCKQYSVYYKSCICGAKGTDTFEDVNGGKNAANHKGTPSTDWTGKDDNKHWQVWSCCGAQVSGTDEAHSGTKWTVGEVTTPATCMTTGVRTYTCEDCGYTKTETIPANGHDFENGTYVYDDTQHWKKCAKCDAEDTANKKEHSGGTATCTAQAICETCKQPYGSMAEHEYEWANNDEYHWKQCKNCDDISGKTNHNVVTDEAKPATTTETGLTEGKHCDVCGKVLVAQEVTPKLTPRYYYNSTTTTTKDTTKKDNTKSPGTFDPGVGVYALTAVLSVTGMAWVGRKRH